MKLNTDLGFIWDFSGFILEIKIKKIMLSKIGYKVLDIKKNQLYFIIKIHKFPFQKYSSIK